MEPRPEKSNTDKIKEWLQGKNLITVLSIAVGVLGIALIAICIGNHKLVRELNNEKEELTEQIINLRADFDSLSSDYADINAQLDTSKEQINQLLERIRKTEATNRQQIRKYQKELGTLRSIMRNYIVQIDSLNSLNKKLTAAAAKARKESANYRKQNETLQKSVDDLSGKVQTASVVRGRNLKVAAYNKNGKAVDRSGAASYLMVSLSLIENAVAQRGPLRIYIAISDAQGNILTNGESTLCDFMGEQVQASASREVDYQGSEVDLGIYFKQSAKFAKGIYNVRAFSETADFGTVQLMLR